MTLVPTPHGEARLTHHRPRKKTTIAAVILHGAGTDTSIPMLVGLADFLAAHEVDTWRLDQPYTLGSRRPPAPAAQLDAVASSVIATLPKRTLFLIGRSSGSRVACRTAKNLGAAGVIALGFPLCPPGTTRSRADELRHASVPVTILQGSRDAFGTPAALEEAETGATVHEIRGADHGFDVRKSDGRSVADIYAEVKDRVLSAVRGQKISWQ